MIWHQIADLLKSGTVAELRQRMTDREFRRWRRYFVWKLNAFDTTHRYLAQIAMEVCRTRLKDPALAQLEHFIIPFTLGEKAAPAKPTGPPTEAEIKQRSIWSQAYWMTLCGYTAPKKDG